MTRNGLAPAVLMVAVAIAAAVPLNAGQQRGAAPPRPRRPAMPRGMAAGGADQPLPVGKGSISGIVAVAGTGQPARRARVNLGSPEGRGRSAITDDSGRFAFAQLPEGRYTMSASK